MVTDRERAQLILIGAILLATIIFGLSLLLNSVLFTGSSGASSADAALADTDVADFEVQRGARELIVRVTHAERNVTEADVRSNVERNVTQFSRLLAEAKAASGSVAVNVTYDDASSRLGYRIVQAHDADFTDADGTPDWTPAPAFPDTTVGWFTANVNVANTSGNALPSIFTVRASNGSESVEVGLNRSGANMTVAVTKSWTPGITNTTTCGSANGRVLVDIYRGSGFTDGCEFTGIDVFDGPTRVTFENGGLIEGQYELVVNRSTPNIGNPAVHRECVDGFGDGRPPAEADPCVAPVIWAANLTTTVHGDGVSFETSRNLTIYTEDS